MVEVALAVVFPVLVASYVGEKVWEHKRHWYVVPKGWKLPKVEVACFGAVIAALGFLAVVLGLH